MMTTIIYKIAQAGKEWAVQMHAGDRWVPIAYRATYEQAQMHLDSIRHIG